MSIDHEEPDTSPIPRYRPGERRRAAIALSILAVGAVIFVVILVAALGVGGGDDPGSTQGANPTGPAVTVTGGSQPVTSPSAAPTTKTRQSTSASSSGPRSGPVSCPTQAPCALPDDVGDVVGAINALRAAKDLPPVTGSVTAAAKQCALSNGNDCPGGFFWEPIGRSGQQFVDKVQSSGHGPGRLIDPSLTAVQVGWAYVPSSQSFLCAVITP